jgi:hypothetical protein
LGEAEGKNDALSVFSFIIMLHDYCFTVAYVELCGMSGAVSNESCLYPSIVEFGGFNLYGIGKIAILGIIPPTRF